MTKTPTIQIIASAVRKAGRAVVRDFGEIEKLQVVRKGLDGFVSSADKRSEKIIIEELRKAKPSYGFITEESGVIDGEDPNFFWIVDPIDGTGNFLHSLPHFCITVALQYKKQTLAGVIYDPLNDDLYWAEKGKGAFVNNRRLRTSKRFEPSECIVGFGRLSCFGDAPELRFQRLKAIMEMKVGIRRMGAAALDLAYVACGKLDAFIQGQLSSWDMAAGILLVEEAGGYVSDLSGGQDMFEKKSIIASNTYLHEKIIKIFTLL